MEPGVYLERALIRRSELSDPDGAGRDAMRVLSSDRASPRQVKRAISMVTPGRLTEVTGAPALTALDDDARAWIAGRIPRTAGEAVVARSMLQPLLTEGRLTRGARTDARRALSLAAIALGRFSEAVQAIQSEVPDVGSMGHRLRFQLRDGPLGPGRGALYAVHSSALCSSATSAGETVPTPNHLQCMAVSHWAAGEPGSRAGACREGQAMDGLRKVGAS